MFSRKQTGHQFDGLFVLLNFIDEVFNLIPLWGILLRGTHCWWLFLGWHHDLLLTCG
jgi:hypothetical protein